MTSSAATESNAPKTSAFALIRPYFRANATLILLGLVCLVVADALQLFIPRVIKWAVDDLALSAGAGERLSNHALTIVMAALLIAVFRYGWRRFLIGTSRKIEEGLRDRLFSHIQTLSAGYFARTSTGSLMAHATNDITNIRMATGMGMVALIDAVFLGTGTIVFMVWINGRLALLALLPMPLIVISARIFSRIMHARYKDVQATFSELTEGVRENLAGIRIIKAYTREARSLARVEDLSRTYVKKNIDLIRVTGSFFPLMLMLSNLSLIIVIYLGGRQTIFGTISPGDLVAFISYLGLLTWPMMALGWMTNLIQRGRASLDRLALILDERPDIAAGGEALCPDGTGIRFEDVAFSYPGGPSPVLTGITLSVAPGRVLGVVGPPGSGKTTLLHLIPRVFDVSRGRLVIGGQDVRDLSPSDLRARISFMPQEPFLFEGRVRDNILIGNTPATDMALSEAVRRAFLHHDIKQFPNGLDTLVGERGVILSGGQKQRVALARTLLHNRPIMIFDDPISQVDTQTGAAVIDGLRLLGRDTCVLISSHRLSAVRHADEIIVLDQGRIVERGTHDQLMTLGGYYAGTSNRQAMEEGCDAI
ncbi:ABC transporter ATP-binding protein [Desulfatiferula olefinivorans]